MDPYQIRKQSANPDHDDDVEDSRKLGNVLRAFLRSPS